MDSTDFAFFYRPTLISTNRVLVHFSLLSTLHLESSPHISIVWFFFSSIEKRITRWSSELFHFLAFVALQKNNPYYCVFSSIFMYLLKICRRHVCVEYKSYQSNAAQEYQRHHKANQAILCKNASLCENTRYKSNRTMEYIRWMNPAFSLKLHNFFLCSNAQ